MKTHILLVDKLEKLSLKKDSTMLLAATLKSRDQAVFLLFEQDFYFDNSSETFFDVYDFQASLSGKIGYLDDFKLTDKTKIKIDEDVIMHFRLDPPFDTRYLRYLWILQGLKNTKGILALNDPGEVCRYNEKMIAYEAQNAAMSFVGSSETGFLKFCEHVGKSGYKEIILKPLDLYQGIGVEKVSLENSLELFNLKKKDFGGAIVAQPFFEEVRQGEKRSIYFAGRHLGSIIKNPKENEFISNIAQGATFEQCLLTSKEQQSCQDMANHLFRLGVPWVAFDLLGEHIQEANITCPGLLVEVSYALKRNLAEDICDLIRDTY